MKTIPLTQGKVALVDDADFEWLSKYRWYAARRPLAGSVQFYAIRYEPKKKKVLMHRQILRCRGKMKADHIDANGLNNQRHNLRKANNAENCRNKSWHPHTSQFKGVSWSERRGYWHSAIKVNYQAIHLGCFDEEVDAAIAYNRAAKLHFGEFAKLNPIPKGWIFTPARIWMGKGSSRKCRRYKYNYESK